MRQGAIVPAVVDDDVTGLGNAASAGALTLLVYPGGEPTSFSGTPYSVTLSAYGPAYRMYPELLRGPSARGGG